MTTMVDKESLTEKSDRRTVLKFLGAGAVGGSSMLAGCGGNSGGDGGDGGGGGGDGGGGGGGGGQQMTGDGDGGSQTETTEGDGGSGAAPTAGGDLVVAMSEDQLGPEGTVAPQLAPGRPATELIANFAEAPLRLATVDEEGTYVPAICSDWQIEDNAIVLTVREGVRFHPPYDREVKGVDLAENFHLIADPEWGAVIHGNIVGPVYQEGMDPTEVADESGEYECTLHLQDSFPHAEDILSDVRGMGIIPPESAEEHGQDLGTPGVGAWGTGPWMLDEMEANNFYRFTKFDGYWGEHEGNQLPYLDSITYRVIPEGAARFAALSAGDVDFILELRGQDATQIQNGSNNLKTHVVEGNRISNHYFNHDQWAPAGDRHLRRAFSFAANRDAINQAGFEGLGTPSVAGVPSWHEFYDNAMDAKETDFGTQTKAEEAQAEWEQVSSDVRSQIEENGFRMITVTGAKHVNTATVLQQNYRSVFGIEPEVISQPRSAGWGQWPGGWTSGGLPEDQDSAVQDNPSEGAHVHSFTALLFASNNYMNLSMYSDDQYDELASQAASSVGTDQFEQRYTELLGYQWEEQPISRLLWQPVMVGYHQSLQNFSPVVNAGEFFHWTWVSEDAPARNRNR